jgi:2-polyprenyl-3-methyl-5-hydroxy-6-metoxy-1,4-benzoquinol methylase
MRISTIFFAKKIECVFNVGPEHHILDYGSGPGFLADYFEMKKISVTSTDINQYYVDQRKNGQSRFLRIATDINTNREIFNHHFGDQKFDFIILLSVVQYFKNMDDVENVVKLLLPYLSENGKLIVGDVISPHTSPYSDAISLFLHCLKEGELFTFIRFISYIMFSDYRVHRAQMKLLTLSDKDVDAIARKNFLNVERLNGLTIHSGRTSYIFRKKAT